MSLYENEKIRKHAEFIAREHVVWNVSYLVSQLAGAALECGSHIDLDYDDIMRVCSQPDVETAASSAIDDMDRDEMVSILVDEYDEDEDQFHQWVAGWNMPGYMPDSEPSTFADVEDAKAFIADSIEEHAEDMPDDEREAAAEMSAAAVEIRTQLADEVGVTLGRYHYFVTKAADAKSDEDVRELLRGYALASHEKAQEFCDAQDISVDEHNEAYEHWIVSNWLEDELKERGEMVGDVLGLTVWGRCTSGQHISMDNVILEISRAALERRGDL